MRETTPDGKWMVVDELRPVLDQEALTAIVEPDPTSAALLYPTIKTERILELWWIDPYWPFPTREDLYNGFNFFRGRHLQGPDRIILPNLAGGQLFATEVQYGSMNV